MVGHWEIIIILIVALLLFGSRLPALARSLGQSIIEFRKGMRSGEDEASRPHELPPGSGPSGSDEKDTKPKS